MKRVRRKSSKIKKVTRYTDRCEAEWRLLTPAETPDASICLGSVAEKPASRGSSVHSVESVESGDDSTVVPFKTGVFSFYRHSTLVAN